MMRAAVEVGGTFTDIIWSDGSGGVRTHKRPSTPGDPSEGVIAGLREALGEGAGALAQLCHGSTVATNAVIERRGCRAALITTRGFRDLLVLQRQLRPDVYAIACEKPAPLIPLSRSIEAQERIAADGSILEPLDEARLLADIDALMAREAPEAVAVCLLHAWRNRAHEDRIGALLAERHPELTVVLSSDVLPAFREYERASTTAMAAYLAPLVGRYLGRLEAHLAGIAPAASFLVMQSSGGMLPSEGVRRRGVEMLNSGPAAGVIGIVRLAERLGDADLITLDVGGTSSDVCLIAGGRPGLTAESGVAGLPVGLPTLDIENVGAGGGSIGWRDAGGMLQVGPRSAGARPGPACYGHGGTDPTLTDSVVHLGWLRPHRFLGGRMPLLPDRAAAVLAPLAGGLGTDPARLAQAIADIAVAHVCRCIRLVSVQRGRDPRAHALYAYGGAGPLLGALAADELRIPRVVIPPHPGLFSALGLLVADLRRIHRETAIHAVTPDAPAEVAAAFARLRAAATAEFARYGRGADEIAFETTLEMRYLGQGFELLVPIDPGRLAAEGAGYLTGLFHAAHRARYGTAAPTDRIEIVTYRLVAEVPGNRDVFDRLAPAGRGIAPEDGHISLGGATVPCRFVDRESLAIGDRIAGCAVVEEPTATTLVPPGWSAHVGAAGALVLEREQPT